MTKRPDIVKSPLYHEDLSDQRPEFHVTQIKRNGWDVVYELWERVRSIKLIRIQIDGERTKITLRRTR